MAKSVDINHSKSLTTRGQTCTTLRSEKEYVHEEEGL
jgi:hypothetical protein